MALGKPELRTPHVGLYRVLLGETSGEVHPVLLLPALFVALSRVYVAIDADHVERLECLSDLVVEQRYIHLPPIARVERFLLNVQEEGRTVSDSDSRQG